MSKREDINKGDEYIMLVYQWISTLGIYRIFDSEHPETTIAIADTPKECKRLCEILNEIREEETNENISY